MPARRHMHRRDVPGNPRFLTFSCYHRLPLFFDDDLKDEFAQRLAAARVQLAFRLHAWVVMPEHVHQLLTPAGTVTAIVTILKTNFARRALNRWRATDPSLVARLVDSEGLTRFWLKGGGFDRNLRGEDEYFRERAYIERAYIHRNPV